MPDIGVISVGEYPRIRQSSWYQFPQPVYLLTDSTSLENARWQETGALRWRFTSLPDSLATFSTHQLSLICPSAFRMAGEAMNKYDA
jgi:hypothetical protein